MIAVLIGCLAASGCGRRQPVPVATANARYTIGDPWRSEGYWFYPTEQPSYRASGLAVVDEPRPAGRVTADGERYDPARPAASHQTLQLPVILRVRNLENGREITLRVNDRGPASPGRLLSVTPRAAQLLGMVPGQATRVRLDEDEPLSRELLRQVDDAPAPDAIAASVAAVQEQSLMPLGEGRQALVFNGREPSPDASRSALGPARPPADLLRPRETVTMEPIEPGQLWIDAGHFNQPSYARRLAAELSGTVRQEGHGHSSVFLVRVGPFDLPAEADAALDQARSTGVTGARIIVE